MSVRRKLEELSQNMWQTDHSAASELYFIPCVPIHKPYMEILTLLGASFLPFMSEISSLLVSHSPILFLLNSKVTVNLNNTPNLNIKQSLYYKLHEKFYLIF